MSSGNKHVSHQLGVYTLVLNKSPPPIFLWISRLRTLAWYPLSFLFDGYLSDGDESEKKGTSSHYACMSVYFVRFIKEIYSLGTYQFWLVIVFGAWEMAIGSLRLYVSARLLSSISNCLTTRHFEPFTIIEALACRIILAVVVEYLEKIDAHNNVILRERVKFYFLQKAMHTSLNLDLLTLEDAEVRNKLTDYQRPLMYHESAAWDAFSSFKRMTFRSLAVLSELSLMFKMSKTSSTFALSTAFCFLDPLMTGLSSSLYSQSFVNFCSNLTFSRMASLLDLAFDERYTEDRLCNNMGHYIEKEFKRSKAELGDVSTDPVYTQWWRRKPIYSKVLENLIWDTSLLFFALRVLWDHTSVSLDELLLVQQASSTFQSSSFSLFWVIERFQDHLRTVRNLYSLEETQNKVKDGALPYPRPSEKNHGGAEIEFRDVSFKYPGTDKNALNDISFAIKPGQLVVIVGVNGSGKSSLIKLLARLYDPSAGEVLLDGLPLSKFKISDVRHATAILRQDHPVLPVSLRENIALGLSGRTATNDDIDEAIRLGGAEKFVQKLKRGQETILNPVKAAYAHFVGNTDTDLKSLLEEKETKTDLSGGETQRLSASRTFLRLLGGNVRLLIADEPTSALDPGGEYELFSRLREHKHGKTVIFITHRFGHLTKYADLILCLKDGGLTEKGTHEELLAAGGEYRRLYDIQAKAFVSSEAGESKEQS